MKSSTYRNSSTLFRIVFWFLDSFFFTKWFSCRGLAGHCSTAGTSVTRSSWLDTRVKCKYEQSVSSQRPISSKGQTVAFTLNCLQVFRKTNQCIWVMNADRKSHTCCSFAAWEYGTRRTMTFRRAAHTVPSSDPQDMAALDPSFPY